MIKICKKCGKEFNADWKKRQFCCKSCANSYNTSQRKILDESIFKNGLNKLNSYILGLIYSDGCLSYDAHSKRYRITIALNDYELMERLRQLMTPNKKLYVSGKANYIVSTNEQDIEFIRMIGIMERKSDKIILPNIPDKFMGDFIRGVFDGDGCVYINKAIRKDKQYNYVYINIASGSDIFTQQLIELFKSKNIISDRILDKRQNCWSVRIRNCPSVKLFYKWIYKDANIYLVRKEEKFHYGDIVQTGPEITGR